MPVVVDQLHPVNSFFDVLEATDPIGDIGLGRNPFESVCETTSVMPCPMGCDKTVQRLVFTDSLEQGMSRGLVVTALDIEGVQPRLEDQGCQDRDPRFEEIYERLVGGE